MTQIQLQIDGLDTTLAYLLVVERGEQLAKGAEAAADDLLGVARHYPPPPEGSRYQRTEDLKRGWGEEPTALTDLVYRVENTGVDYATYVLGDDQAEIHRGRWKTVDQITADEEGQVEQRLDQAVEELIR